MSISKLKLNYLPELKTILFGRKRPTMVSVNLTSKCNQSCVYCEINKTSSIIRDSEQLDKDDLFWIIDQMALIGIKRLSLCGGEPFLFNDIIDVVAYASEKTIVCNISSNGMVLCEKTLEELAILKKCQTHVNISIDSFNDDIQSKVRGNRSALKNALCAIKVLQRHHIPYTVLTAISNFNFSDLSHSFIEAKKIGVKEIIYQPIIYASNYPEKNPIDEKGKINVSLENLAEMQAQLKTIAKYEKRSALKTNTYRLKPWINEYIKSSCLKVEKPFYKKVLKKFHCREVYAVIDIDYYGGIQPCGLLKAEVNIKNHNNENLLSLWNLATKNLKENLYTGDFPEVCDSCCHKFSRNMLSSIMKYPLVNSKTLVIIFILLSKRIANQFIKTIFIK